MMFHTFLSITLDTAAGAELYQTLVDAKSLATWTDKPVDFRFNDFSFRVYKDTNIQGELDAYNRHNQRKKDQCYAYRPVAGARVAVGSGEPGPGVVPMAYGPRWSMEAFAETENKR